MNASHGVPGARRRRCLLWRRPLTAPHVLPFPNPRSNRAPLTSRHQLPPPHLPALQYAFQIRANTTRQKSSRTVINKSRPPVCTRLARPEFLCFSQARVCGYGGRAPAGYSSDVGQLSGLGSRSAGCLLRLPARTSSSHHCV